MRSCIKRLQSEERAATRASRFCARVCYSCLLCTAVRTRTSPTRLTPTTRAAWCVVDPVLDACYDRGDTGIYSNIRPKNMFSGRRGSLPKASYRTSFYGTSTNFSSTKTAGFETSSRPYLLKIRCSPCHLGVSRSTVLPLHPRKYRKDIFFVASFLASSSHETFVEGKRKKKNAGLGREGYRKISRHFGGKLTWN